MYIKKRYILITMVLIVSLLIPTVINAAEEYIKTIEVSVNTVNVTANGQPVETDNFLYNGTTYIPLRAVSEQLGAVVNWDDATKTASIMMQANNFNKILDTVHGYSLMKTICNEIIELKYYIEVIAYNNITPYSNEHTLALLEDIKNVFNEKYNLFNDNFYVIKTEFITNNSDILSAWAKCAENAYYYVAAAISALGLQAEAEHSNDDVSFVSCKDIVYDCIENIDLYIKTGIYLANQNYTAQRLSGGQESIADRYFIRTEYLKDEFYLHMLDFINETKLLNHKSINIYTPQFSTTVPATNDYVPEIVVIANKPTQTTTITQDNLKDNEYTFPLHLYSNDGKTYLGKCVTDDMDKDGIYYKFFGDYSSDFSQTSIWNDFSPYGGTIGNESAFNTIAQKPPKIVDNNGKFVVYLSINDKIEPRWTIEQLRQFLVNNNQ